ncbi:MAG: pyrroline-5-carboxylate reductase [Propionibacteriaceae bacterium]|nr:pyrroline-5-carboxylate reductase [Propionibacteriaceae bacterium]
MTIAILGVGMMGEALLGGLLGAGWENDDVRAADSRASRREEIAQTYQVWTGTSMEAVKGADVVVVAVKSADVPDLLGTIGPVLAPGALVISLVAGASAAVIERHLVLERPVIRAMPNTPVNVGEGMTAICAGSSATKEHLATAEKVLSSVGRVIVVPEKQMDAVTAISGSGPAYMMLIAEAMIDAGVLLGLPRATAAQLAKQTIYGSGMMLVETGVHPAVLRENVTSPGGTTASALRVLEERGVRPAFIAAVEAAARRSEEMGRAQSK